MTNNEIKTLYQESCDLIEPYIRLEGQKPGDINTPEGKEALRKGMEGLETVLLHIPDSWGSQWMLGKIHQIKGDHEAAYLSFLNSHRNILDNPSVLRELALECLHTKRFAQAVHFCHVAMQFDPDDYTLYPNMAVAQLFNGNIGEAEQWANKALAKIPNDEPAKNVLKITAEIKAGIRQMPTDFFDLERET